MKSLLMVLIGTLIFYTSYTQNVGIGKTNPQAKLEIKQTSSLEPTVMLSDSVGGYGGRLRFRSLLSQYSNRSWYTDYKVGTYSKDNEIFLYNDSTNVMNIYGTGNITIGDAVTPDARLTILSDNPSSDILNIMGGSYQPALKITGDRNVGVGTPTPQQKLDVNGAIKVSTTGTNQPGTIRFNAGKFEGGDGANWKNFEGTATGIVGTKLYNNPALLNAGYSLFGEIPGIKSYSTINTTFPANTWQPSYTRGIVTNVSAPEGGAAVWNGSLMYVATPFGLYSYNPTTDIWSIVSNQGFGGDKGIWTGTEIIFWSGGTVEGARYNPSTNTWANLPISNAPSSRFQYTMIWDGSRVIIWGGVSGGGTDLNTGAMYDPSTNSWATMSTSGLGAPTARFNHTAIWNNVTGRMIIWGGSNSLLGINNTGGLFNPVMNIWTGATNNTNAPVIREGHTAVWTGTEMIIFGGIGFGSLVLNTGGKYNPSTNNWTPTNSSDAFPIYNHAAVWTGSIMIVTGGEYYYPGYSTNSSKSYNPLTDLWTNIGGFPDYDGKSNHNSFYANNMIIIWGGEIRTPSSRGPSKSGGYRYFLVNIASSATTITNETLYLYQKN